MMCINTSMSLSLSHSLCFFLFFFLSLSLSIYTSQNCRKIVRTCRASGVFWPSLWQCTDRSWLPIFQYQRCIPLVNSWVTMLHQQLLVTTRKRINSPKKFSPKSTENHGKLLAFDARFGKTSMIAAWIYSFRMRFDQWRAVLGFERTNPLQLEGEELAARVALVYQQAGRRVSLQITRFFLGRPVKGTSVAELKRCLYLHDLFRLLPFGGYVWV